MKKWLIILIVAIALPGLAKSVKPVRDTSTASPKQPVKISAANCYIRFSNPIVRNNLTYIGKLAPGCTIQIAVKPLTNLKTKTYIGDFCITSKLNDVNCSAKASDGFSVGPSGSEHSPENYTNKSKETKYIRMFGCLESLSPSQPKASIKPSCHEIFEINQKSS